jgi:hypothetical protein
VVILWALNPTLFVFCGNFGCPKMNSKNTSDSCHKINVGKVQPFQRKHLRRLVVFVNACLSFNDDSQIAWSNATVKNEIKSKGGKFRPSLLTWSLRHC